MREFFGSVIDWVAEHPGPITIGGAIGSVILFSVSAPLAGGIVLGFTVAEGILYVRQHRVEQRQNQALELAQQQAQSAQDTAQASAAVADHRLQRIQTLETQHAETTRRLGESQRETGDLREQYGQVQLRAERLQDTLNQWQIDFNQERQRAQQLQDELDRARQQAQQREEQLRAVLHRPPAVVPVVPRPVPRIEAVDKRQAEIPRDIPIPLREPDKQPEAVLLSQSPGVALIAPKMPQRRTRPTGVQSAPKNGL